MPSVWAWIPRWFAATNATRLWRYSVSQRERDHADLRIEPGTYQAEVTDLAAGQTRRVEWTVR